MPASDNRYYDLNRIKAVVFDCDGVLFDTADANRKYYDEILDCFGKERLDEEQFAKVHMFTVKQALAYLFPEKADMAEVYACLKNIGYDKFIKYMHMAPGLEKLLLNLKRNGYIRGVATNRTDTMERVLRENGLAEQFDMVVTAADVENPKPAPDQLLKIMQAYGLDAGQVIFVGDSEYDMLAAMKAGTVFAAFRSPQLKADMQLENMDQIGEILHIY